MAVDASSVTTPAGELKTEIENLAGKFTEDVIYSSEGASMSNAGKTIKDNGETNCNEIKEAATKMADIANNLTF